MVTDSVLLDNYGRGRQEAMELTEQFASEQSLPHKEVLRLCLLSEEMIGMVREITGEFEGRFCIRGDNTGCVLQLVCETFMDSRKRRELLAVSSSGKNEAAKGFMGKIRDIVENYLLFYDEEGQQAFQAGEMDAGFLSMGMDNKTAGGGSNLLDMQMWSFRRYKDSAAKSGGNIKETDVWDELEKSIVARLADEVQVGIKNGKVELDIFRKY